MIQPYEEVQDWEKAIGITVSHFENHQEYHLQMAKAYHITWKNLNDSFMGHSIEYWAALYKEDEHLNNHPLRYFDEFHPGDRLIARSLPGKTHLSLSMTVCMRKCVIKDAVLRYLKQYSYSYSGKMPCTGLYRCIFCGKPKDETKKN